MNTYVELNSIIKRKDIRKSIILSENLILDSLLFIIKHHNIDDVFEQYVLHDFLSDHLNLYEDLPNGKQIASIVTDLVNVILSDNSTRSTFKSLEYEILLLKEKNNLNTNKSS